MIQESRLEGEIRVKDFDLFLEKSKQGINLVYQLHRKLGSTFIDASFQDRENPSLLFKMRIHLDPPRLSHSDIRWDEYGFPYELETYTASDNAEIIVPLYRSEHSSAMTKFLEDVVEYEIQDNFKGTPQKIRKRCLFVLDLIDRISKILEKIREEAGDEEIKAVDAYFGEAGIFDFPGDSAVYALARFLEGTILENIRYKEAKNVAQEKRQKALIEEENKAVNRLENTLKTHNFKQGFVSMEAVV
jgi:hypothetical protein